jgi:outer membrane lipoprotein SlyB
MSASTRTDLLSLDASALDSSSVPAPKLESKQNEAADAPTTETTKLLAKKPLPAFVVSFDELIDAVEKANLNDKSVDLEQDVVDTFVERRDALVESLQALKSKTQSFVKHKTITEADAAEIVASAKGYISDLLVKVQNNEIISPEELNAAKTEYQAKMGKFQTVKHDPLWQKIVGAVAGAVIGFVAGLLAGAWAGPAAAITALLGGVKGAIIGASAGVAVGSLMGFSMFHTLNKRPTQFTQLNEVEKNAEELFRPTPVKASA